MKMCSFCITKDHIKLLERYVKDGDFTDKSEVIRTILRDWLVDHLEKNPLPEVKSRKIVEIVTHVNDTHIEIPGYKSFTVGRRLKT
jgi:Arc/MetJ-type ribon-helix-helix transcriptional regulator